ncbi:uncharacterized protein BJX67DRAFT_298972 [Aspergillus lucknowensis]|uniref:Uncharacterized protein n=1 Tax=Aspergillus lucknowensis TaxID=176173 RepID=A0ABR4LDA5_9EURO
MFMPTSLKMPLRWRKRPQRPPVPFVEDEVDSLSRELNGSSHRGEPPGLEGVKARGTINQSPVILDVEILIVSNPSSNVEEKPSTGTHLSGFNANQPTRELNTRQELKQNPLRRPAGGSQHQEPGKPHSWSPTKSQDIRSRAKPPHLAHTQVSGAQKSGFAYTENPVPRQSERAPRPPAQKGPLSSKSVPDTTRKSESTPSRRSSVRREREQHQSSSPTRPRPEPVLGPSVETDALPPKRTLDIARKSHAGASRNPPARGEKEYHSSVPTTRQYSDSVQDPNVRADPLPPKRTPDVTHLTHQREPTAPGPLPVPQDGRCHSSAVSNQSEAAAQDSSVRVDQVPSRSMPSLPQANQSTPQPSPVSRTGQHKTASTISPRKPLLETPQRGQTIPLNPLPNPLAQGATQPSASTVKRSRSLKHRPSTKAVAVDPRSTSGYTSDSAAVHQSRGPTSKGANPQAVKGSFPSGPSIAERLEEKLKIRREQRESGDPLNSTAQEHSANPKTTDASVSSAVEQPIAPTQLPGAWPTDSPSNTPSTDVSRFPGFEVGTEEAKLQESTAAPLKSALRSQSLDRNQLATAQPNRRRAVSFAEKPLEQPSQALIKVDHETSLAPVQRRDVSPDSGRSTSPNAHLTLAPCPRSVPVAGYQDWHTIDGLNHLDICPSCVKQMRRSRFRDRIKLSAPKPRTEPIRCAMSEPWTRLAWMQTLNKKLDNLDLLLEVTLSPPGSKPCTGRIISDQYWFRIIDPETGRYLPQFNVCPACVRNIRLLMPAHRETFERSGTPQERVCDFVVDSPRFIRYIDALDLSANRAEQEDTTPDLSEFLAYARRKVVLRDCRRSRLIFNTWHYMPQLPEFTVCEDCYDDIVWPLAKARYPIALEFSTVMRLLPGDKTSSSREASCQLYSPRIRAKFNDAVRRNDMQFVKWMALTRFDAEQRFRDRQDELLEDQDRGYDCSGDLRKNLEDWKRYE